MDEFEKHKAITDNFLKEEEARDASAAKNKDDSSLSDAEKAKTKETEEAKKVEETKKAEETEKVKKADETKKAEEKAKEDEKILDTPDEELEEKQKTRKAELLKAKESKKKPEEQDRLNKRFGELTGEIKDLKQEKNLDREKILELEKQLSEIKEKLNPPKENLEKDAEKERLKKYLDEDKDKPKEERREMPKEDLEEWLLEDSVAANEWLVERSLRRSDERKQFRGNQEKKKFVDALVSKMEQSSKKVEAKHPELNTKGRAEELKKEGKPEKEIHAVLYEENEKYRLMYDIMKEDPKKYWVENGPELLAEEMEKRLGKTTKAKGKEFTDEELEKIKEDARKEALEVEKERIASLDEGSSSSRSKATPKKTKLSPEMEAKKKDLIRRAGLTEEEFEESVKRRETLGV